MLVRRENSIGMTTDSPGDGILHQLIRISGKDTGCPSNVGYPPTAFDRSTARPGEGRDSGDQFSYML
jgi:hypothetical protein